ncbi:DUF397 domain-containing protein [Salinispora arenicola]|uniref:DUF397 domain-containing protein n=1 Tax=Salinispora arenicola TaxID=168697 RepID=UPI00037A02D1|nr:DUF397 domain-containing protein [Salinispora arenicola]
MAAKTWVDPIEPSRVAWHVSTHSGSGGGDCVEAGLALDGSRRVAVRDSKDRSGPILVYSAASWTGFLTGLRSGTPTG